MSRFHPHFFRLPDVNVHLILVVFFFAIIMVIYGASNRFPKWCYAKKEIGVAATYMASATKKSMNSLLLSKGLLSKEQTKPIIIVSTSNTHLKLG